MFRSRAFPSPVVSARTNARVGQPWSQKALPAACEFTVALNWCLRPSRIKRVGLPRTSLPYPTPMLLSGPGQGCRARPAVQMQRSRCLGPSVKAQSAFAQAGLASAKSALCLLVGQRRRSQLRLAGSQAVARSQVRHSRSPLTRSTRAAKQAAGWQTPAVVGLLQSLRANPSVKGTSTSGLRPLAAAPYVER